ncbi:GMC oxidoreductase [Astrocystis sublimbata]|nr:GMC oxidoreductase [Astrocystis sublimbata]
MWYQLIAACLAFLATGVDSAALKQLQPPVGRRGFDSDVLLSSSFGVPGRDATYDYVVVGGGNAGLALATRLVEQGVGSVAVVEAGTFYELSTGNISDVPATSATWAGKSVTDWQPLADWGYITTPQAGANNDSIHYPRGKMLGGSSARNFMIYQRGSVGSYQRWADAVGDDSYTFKKFLPYFEKSTKFTAPRNDIRLQNATPQFNAAEWGQDGPVSIIYPNWAYAFGTWAVKAFSAIGIPLRKEGFNSGGLLGYAYTTFTIDAKKQIRSSSETYLRKTIGDPNYFVYPLTLAKKIIFDQSKTAKGVRVDTQGASYTLSARKEVILAAGVFGSPQLLQVSGVGPAKLLKSVGVPVVSDRPGVGQNMEDHIFFGVTHAVNLITTSSLGNPDVLYEQETLFDTKAEGLLTSPAADVLGWEKLPRKTRSILSNSTLTALATYPADWPEVEYVTFSTFSGNNSVFTTTDPNDGKNYASIGVALITPRSRGTVMITSKDTSVAPAINPMFLTDRADIEVSIGGFKRAREFWKSKVLRDIVLGDEAFPGLDVQTDSEIEASIRENFQTVFHGACTCAMGKKTDTNAVVDSKARVYGVKGLRVVDASAFPLLPPGHPMSTVYALAEKIACDISGKC